MNELNPAEHKIHNEAMNLAKVHAKAMRDLVEILIQVESKNIHKKLGRKNMFLYATKALNLDEPLALMLINVARKSKAFPVLREAIAEAKLSPSKASRLVAHLKNENAQEIASHQSPKTTFRSQPS